MHMELKLETKVGVLNEVKCYSIVHELDPFTHYACWVGMDLHKKFFASP